MARARRAHGDGAALHPGDHGRRQARAADRRQAGAALPRAHPEGGRDARQPRRRRHAAWRSRCPRATARSRRRSGPVLAKRGLLLVGLDVIGDYLTEVNVTSPTCFREITGPDRLRRRRHVHRRAGSTEDLMIGVLLVTHGSIGRPAHERAQILGGTPAQVATLAVWRRTIPTTWCCARASCSRALDAGDGVLVLTDIYGATPGNIGVAPARGRPRRGRLGRVAADAAARAHLAATGRSARGARRRSPAAPRAWCT